MLIEEVLFKNAFVILQNAKNLPPELNTVVDMIVEEAKANRHIVWLGVGKCRLVSEMACSTANSLGLPSISLCGFDSLHGSLGSIIENQLIISFSKSGETEEILQCLEGAGKKGAKIVSISCKKQSSAGKIAQKYNGLDISLMCDEEADALDLAPSNSIVFFASLSNSLCIVSSDKLGFTRSEFLANHSSGSLAKKIKEELEVENGKK